MRCDTWLLIGLLLCATVAVGAQEPQPGGEFVPPPVPPTLTEDREPPAASAPVSPADLERALVRVGRLQRRVLTAARRVSQARAARAQAEKVLQTASRRLQVAREEREKVAREQGPTAELGRLQAEERRALEDFEQARKALAAFRPEIERTLQGAELQAYEEASARYQAAQAARDRARTSLTKFRSQPGHPQEVTPARAQEADYALQHTQQQVQQAEQDAERAGAERKRLGGEEQAARDELSRALDELGTAIGPLEGAFDGHERASRQAREQLEEQLDELGKGTLAYNWEQLTRAREDYLEVLRRLRSGIDAADLDEVEVRVRRARSQLGIAGREWEHGLVRGRELAEILAEEKEVFQRRVARAEQARLAEEQAAWAARARLGALTEFIRYVYSHGGEADAGRLAGLLQQGLSASWEDEQAWLESPADRLSRIAFAESRSLFERVVDLLSLRAAGRVIVSYWYGEDSRCSSPWAAGWSRGYVGTAPVPSTGVSPALSVALHDAWTPWAGSLTALGVQSLYGYFVARLADSILRVGVRELDRYGEAQAYQELELSGKDQQLWLAEEGEGVGARLLLREADGSVLIFTWGPATRLRILRASGSP